MSETFQPSHDPHAEDDLLELIDEHDLPAAAHPVGEPWRVLIVDDDSDVHKATELAMQGLLIEGRKLQFLHAHSASEARDVLAREPNLAVALLDVVMESEDAGLQLVRHIRADSSLDAMRIVLRTGQPGYAPEIETVRSLDINDYKTKSELTRTRLYTVLTAAIRSYKQICELQVGRRGLSRILHAANELSRLRTLPQFAACALEQLCALFECPSVGLVAVQHRSDTPDMARIVAASGRFTELLGATVGRLTDDASHEAIDLAFTQAQSHIGALLTLHFKLPNERNVVLHAVLDRKPEDNEEPLLQTYLSTLSISFDNVVMYGQLLDHAYNDQLLQLPNRNRFIELLEKHLLAPEGLALALIDIDDFSDINDAFGHRFGDQVLQSVAARLGEQLGERTEMARISADTFGLMGPSAHINAASISHVFAEPFDVSGERLQLSATSGLVSLSDSSTLGSELLLDAHIALKRAKLMHRGACQYFSAEMGVDARERFKLLKGLRASFEARRLFVVYQPQVELNSRRVVGVEALLRWRTEDGRFVPPDQFIPLAEQSGLIISIGEFVLRTACFQVKRMRELGHTEVRMAINISMAQFRHPQFIPTLRAAIHEADIPGAALELEITESMAMDDVDMVLKILAAIRATGATVAIDDFGTGFSSLSQLRQLQVERLKIDRAFVQEAECSVAGSTIAAMVVNLGRSLGMQVLAEGIETEDQATHLIQMGCHEGQGYLFARPMPADQFENWLTEYRAAHP
ncbi:EAL domain-containing response regulator [Inhella gelatinilytica]|uniref:EAL domain-containing protein n=1 Tax=Inhella gelatinilytica TaxID=2795030 RepID=A0A931IUJ2_9BURK|nr:EAL domain-containing protein [Inhella gelatinilytica]MBH9551265.1 EAL domain-containing protein [Inhella gelatinilytica]